MKSLLKFLLICSGMLFLQCHHSYKFIIGETYFKKASDREYSALAGLEGQTALTLKGVYGKKQIGREWFPVLFSYTSKGIAYTFLAETLPINDNTYIQITGIPVSKKLSLGVKSAAMEIRALQVREHHELFQTALFIEKSTREYKRIYKKIESVIKPDHVQGWKFAPRWQSIVDEKYGKIIVISKTADLMYQYEINFVYPIKSESLQAVYCRRWFKGE